MKTALRSLLLAAAVLGGLHAAQPARARDVVELIRGSDATFTPGTPIRVEARTNRPAEVEVALFRTTPERVAAHADARYAATALSPGDLGRPLVTVRDRVHAQAPQPLLHAVTLGVFPPGLYVARMRAGGRDVAAHLVSVTTLGVLSGGGTDGLQALALDLRSLHARSDVTFERYGADGHVAERRRVDASGLATFAGNDGNAVIARADDGSVTLAFTPSSFEQPQQSAYVQLDRPIYRPGHRVSYRAILRDGKPGSYAVPSGERVVTVRDDDDKVIATQVRALDAFGTLSGEIALSDDAALGVYRLAVGDVAGAQFAVEAYKKPEFTIELAAPAATTIGGDAVRFAVGARYFFGRPASGLKLHYRGDYVRAYAWWRRGSPFRFAGYPQSSAEVPPPVEGDLRADGAGRATIVLPTRPTEAEDVLRLEVDGRDESGHTVTAQTRASVVPASFFVTVTPATYFNPLGEDVVLAVHSRSYANAVRPHAAVSLTFTPIASDPHGALPGEPDPPASVVTDASGAADVRWHPRRAGLYEIAARAFDERGRVVASTNSVWISAQRYESDYRFESTTVVPQKNAYRPGERATVLVSAPQGDVDALVRVSGGRAFVARLAGPITTLTIDPPPDAVHYRVSVSAPTRHGVAVGSALIDVVPQPHRLTVAVVPAKKRYGPGEPARFALTVRDGDGKPVRAQVGLAVVDDAIFALRDATSSDPYQRFYGRYEPYRAFASWDGLDDPVVSNAYLMMIGRTRSDSATRFGPSATADVYSVGGAPPLAALRTDFRDTAYWAPAVVTGADGRAEVAFTWPDSLTSYTASGLAVTQATDVGSGAGAALVSKDFLVRLEAPRFLRRGDRARITAVAHGARGAAGARLRFAAPGLGVADDTRSVRFDRRATASAWWEVRAGELGAPALRLAGASGTLLDGVRGALPVEAAGTAEHQRGAGALPGAAELDLWLPPGAEAGDLRIDLAPSPVAQLLASVHLLDVYPYGCVEQTMSAALPAVFVDRLRKRSGLPLGDGPKPTQVAQRAVDRLAQLQHADGSWGWWDHDAANPFMTAYALYGLAELRRDGSALPHDLVERGAASLVRQLGAANGDTLAFHGGPQPGSAWNTRAFMLFALADAKPAAVDRALLAQADAHAAGLNPYALAVLGLAHVELGDRAGAAPLLAELGRRASDDGTFTYWRGDGWHYRWQDDPVETTAYALRFLHAMAPDDPRVSRAVAWLRAQQHGSWYYTTKDTAAAVYALSEAIAPQPGEFAPHETVRITLDGRPLRTVRIDAPVLPTALSAVTVPARLLHAGGRLRFERAGTGALFWSTDWTRYAPAGTSVSDLDPAATSRLGGDGVLPFHVRRSYYTGHTGPWRVGDQVEVDLVVTTERDAQYVAIEDPLPAGLEYQPVQHESGQDWSGLQFFDDRLVFFATRLAARAPLHLHYRLRATTPGSFIASAPTVYAMYGPPVSAVGRVEHVVVR